MSLQSPKTQLKSHLRFPQHLFLHFFAFQIRCSSPRLALSQFLHGDCHFHSGFIFLYEIELNLFNLTALKEILSFCPLTSSKTNQLDFLEAECIQKFPNKNRVSNLNHLKPSKSSLKWKTSIHDSKKFLDQILFRKSLHSSAWDISLSKAFFGFSSSWPP